MLLQGPELRKFLYTAGKSSFRQAAVVAYSLAKFLQKQGDSCEEDPAYYRRSSVFRRSDVTHERDCKSANLPAALVQVARFRSGGSVGRRKLSAVKTCFPQLRTLAYSPADSSKLKEIRVKKTILFLAAFLFAVMLIAPTYSSANVPICPPGIKCD